MGPSRSLVVSPFDRAHMTSYWRSIVTMALSRVVSEIFNVEECRDLEIGVQSPRLLKVIGSDTYWSVTYDFLLTFHSIHEPISHRFRDRRRFQSKIAKKNSYPRVFCAPTDGVPLRIGHRCRGQKKTGMMGLPEGPKKFNICLAV